jgi:hypothetical protein
MSMGQLLLAGAPALPDGWFYRLRESIHVGYKLEIREQRRFGSRLVAEVHVLEERHDDMTDAVVAACQRAHRTVEERAQQREKYAALSDLVGDHDPKGGRP